MYAIEATALAISYTRFSSMLRLIKEAEFGFSSEAKTKYVISRMRDIVIMPEKM